VTQVATNRGSDQLEAELRHLAGGYTCCIPCRRTRTSSNWRRRGARRSTSAAGGEKGNPPHLVNEEGSLSLPTAARPFPKAPCSAVFVERYPSAVRLPAVSGARPCLTPCRPYAPPIRTRRSRVQNRTAQRNLARVDPTLRGRCDRRALRSCPRNMCQQCPPSRGLGDLATPWGFSLICTVQLRR
jgi:hypothetical protein